jgi:STE24 endopeptidase
VVLIAGLAMLVLLFPLLLRKVWITRPLKPGPLRSRLENAAARWGFRARDILVWHTDGLVANAAVAGLLPPFRYVFLTDALLERLTDDEIEAVFGHEVGHVRHHHLLFRVMAMLAPLGLWWLWQQAYPESLRWAERILLTGGVTVRAQAGLALVAALGVYLLVVFGYYARLLEHQADLFGCRVLSPEPGCSPVAAFSSALEKLAAGNGMRRTARGWQHASIARRIGFLQQLYQDPKRNLRFQRRVLLLGGLVICVALSPLVYWLLPG